MKCSVINQQIDAYLQQELSPLDKLAFEQHVANCDACAEQLAAAQGLLADLKNLPIAPPSADFEQRMFAKVRKRYKQDAAHSHGFRFAAGFATATVAGLAIWLAVGTQTPDDVLRGQTPMISVALHDAEPVRLMFDSESDIQNADLRIDLPDNVALAGYPGRRELSWHTSLKKGPNVLNLPIMAIDTGQGELSAQLSYHDKVKTYRLLLNTTAAPSQ
ncbi:MAG: zf-HC2 domain-containing protein [Chromatiales bacterium]|jgi:hypothetical protein